ncbi:MAG: (Fe-S)-binding protein [Candidatus Hodarchaeota archaeon]
MSHFQPRTKNVFNETSCTRCGECFHRCPELQLSIDIAKEEITNLIEGKTSLHVLWHCTTCFSCNLYCPHDCKPYQLILERWSNLYLRRGAPSIYRFVCPTIEGNIWHMVDSLLSKEERIWIHRWMTQKPKETILLIGNFIHLLPFIIGDSKFLDYFTPVDLLDHWECGAYLYQGGYLDVVKRIAEKNKRDFNRWNVKTIVPLLDAVHWMLTEVHPQEMGVSVKQEVLNFHEWLLNHIQRKEIVLNIPVNMKVTIHDNCYSKAGNGKYWETPRKILKHTNCEIIEMKNNRTDALCCGFGAGASWRQEINIPFDILNTSYKKFQEAEATGADALVTYCGGCLYLLWAAKELFESKIDVYHSVEIVRLAMGEKIHYPKLHVRRAWDIIAIITYHLVLSLFRRNFKIQEISFKQKPWNPHRFLILRVIRSLFDFQIIRIFYRKTFRVLMPRMISKQVIERR